MNRNDIVATLEKCGTAPALRSQDAGRMRLVDDEHRTAIACQRRKLLEIGPIAIHTIKTFNDDPSAARASTVAPATDLVVN